MRLLRVRRILPTRLPAATAASELLHDRQQLGSLQSESLQRRQSLPLCAQHMARASRREMEPVALDAASGSRTIHSFACSRRSTRV